MKRKGTKGPYLLFSDQPSVESPKMPVIQEHNKLFQHQISGKGLMSPKEGKECMNSVKLPHIAKCFSEIEPQPDDTFKYLVRMGVVHDIKR